MHTKNLSAQDIIQQPFAELIQAMPQSTTAITAVTHTSKTSFKYQSFLEAYVWETRLNELMA
jgi:hypothetical protein